MTTHVTVTGAKGHMSSTVVEAVRAAEGMELVVALDAENEIPPESLNAAGVAVDFFIPSVTESNVHTLLDAGVDVVIGTTGWTEESYERIRVYTEKLGRAVLIAPSFAMGVVLTIKFAALAAPCLESAEVIEMHHPDRVNAPSGTAITTAREIGVARKGTGLGSVPDATRSDPEGTRGGPTGDVPVHAVRLHGLIASREILLGNPSEQLVIRTDSLGRVSFVPDVVLAIRSIRSRVGLAIGLDKILGI